MKVAAAEGEDEKKGERGSWLVGGIWRRRRRLTE